MISIPPPGRVPVGTASINGQRVEVFIDPEWDRYLQSLTGQINETSTTVFSIASTIANGLIAEDAAETEMPFFYPQPSAGGGEFKAVSVDVPYSQKEYVFNVIDALVTPLSKVIVLDGAYDQTDVNNPADIQFHVQGVTSGSFALVITAKDRAIGGLYKFNYTLG